MTAQISDSLSFVGRTYSIVGVNGSGLFDPKALGMSAARLSTACYRGFYCTYAVRGRAGPDRGGPDRWLLLDNLHIRLVPPQPTVIYGKEPESTSPHGDAEYAGMSAPIPYTGGLLIGHDFIREMYVHMGFHPPYKYRVVKELIFEAGRLVKATDQSEIMEKIRESLRDRALAPGRDASEEEIKRWIEGTFSLKYW